jgi:hypothetical protein
MSVNDHPLPARDSVYNFPVTTREDLLDAAIALTSGIDRLIEIAHHDALRSVSWSGARDALNELRNVCQSDRRTICNHLKMLIRLYPDDKESN